jgi:tetratricopeptide (TPR) repeat protein
MAGSDEEEYSGDEEIQTASVEQLIRAVKKTESYSFLIGAGTSKSANIPTSEELIEKWRKECYEDCNPEEDIEDWVETQEMQNIGQRQSQYGYWFERLHPTPGERRQRIQELVEDADTTPGHIILASLMSDEGERNYVPVTLTPNFDDLLFDAFYLYLEHRPQLINHRAVAPEFKLTRNDPAIVKLHGDYLYSNLHNTDEETESLEESMETAVGQTVGEYGLVAIGYGGNDESIMAALRDAEFSEYGLYWCVMEPDDGESIKSQLSEEVQELLRETESYVVPIKGFVTLMLKFEQEIADVSIPEREELKNRADERRDRIDDMIEQFSEEAEDKEEEVLLDLMQLHSDAADAYKNAEYQKSIDKLNTLLELDPEVPEAYYNRGTAKGQLGNHKAAIEDFDKAIKHDPEDPRYYNNRGMANRNLERYDLAIDDFDKAVSLDSEHRSSILNRIETQIEIEEFDTAKEAAAKSKIESDSIEATAVSLLLYLISSIVPDEKTEPEEEEYRKLCKQEFTTDWEFTHLESWIEQAEINKENKEKISELIDLLRDHKESTR